jgi:adenosine deaminase
MKQKFDKNAIQRWGKGGTHEHFDCSIEPEFIIARGVELGVTLPEQVISAWRAAGRDEAARAIVARDFQTTMSTDARASLQNYLNAIGTYVLPVLQTQDDLYDRAMSRFRRAEEDGLLWLKLRFAPQLHRLKGLTLPQVMEPMVAAVHDSPIPAKLVVCALRHENGRLGQHLANMCIRYSKDVANFDLAGGEGMKPGVLEWWAKQAVRVRQATNGRTKPSIHLWEECEPTAEDLQRLRKYRIHELAHGFRGKHQGNRVCAMCVTSNIITAQVENASQHAIDELYREGRRVCVDTDGTLFTMTDYTSEYQLLHETFGWQPEDFLRCNLNALSVSGFTTRQKRAIEAKLRATYPV